MTKLKTTKAPALITDAGKLTAHIDGIARRGKKWDADVQLAALSVIAHLDKHGDITLVNRLHLAMPGGARRASLSQWLLNYGKCSANTGPNKREVPFVYDKTKTTDMDTAVTVSWYEAGAPERDPDELVEVLPMLNRLIARMKNSNTDHPEVLPQLEMLAAGLVAASPKPDTLDEQDAADRKNDAPRQPQRTVVKKDTVTTH